MARRSTPHAQRDDLAFPVRVKLKVGPYGLGRQLTDMQAWLDAHLGTGNYATHAGWSVACNAASFYFRTTEAAHRFRSAFPDAELADGTLSPVYRS